MNVVAEPGKKRLAALGVAGDLDSRVAKARAELETLRTRKLNASGTGTLLPGAMFGRTSAF